MSFVKHIQKHIPMSEEQAQSLYISIKKELEVIRINDLMSNKEVQENKLRLFLEKQGSGVKNKVYGLLTDYSQCNLTSGTY